jgi:hypothetical protein
MPKLRNFAPGRRISAWVRARNFDMWDQIENKSAFLQLCIDNAIDIMAWDILKKADPETYHVEHRASVEEIVGAFNEKHPLDPLTAKRLGKTNGQKSVREIEPASQEQNPAL